MRLGEFIAANVEPILSEWETFARGIWPQDSPAEPTELRDSAAEILRATVAEMAQEQTAHEQSERSMGRAIPGGAESDRLDDASEVHGAGRVVSGLSIREVVAEYRALRSSVLRLWRASVPQPDAHDLEDVTRFNEAMDQSLARAVSSFSRRLDASRKTFLAMLGHDLRSPLAAITLSAKLAAAGITPADHLPELLQQVIFSAGTINELVTALMDFTSSTMGVRLPMAPAATDLAAVCADLAREVRAAHPGWEVRIETRGDLQGTWDAHRVRQVLGNLLGNAIQHGMDGAPVTLTADGTDEAEVVVRVNNAGEPIPREELSTIFDPLVRGRNTVHERRTPGSIGLGLYIAREIATAHGGTVTLSSTAAEGTTATVRIPRHVRGPERGG